MENKESNSELGRFYKLPVKLAARRDVASGAKIVVAVIMNRFGKNDHCWPGLRTIARDAGLSKFGAIKAIRQAEAKHVLKVERQGPGRRNRYCLPEMESGQLSIPVNKVDQSTEYTSDGQQSCPEAVNTVDHKKIRSINKTKRSARFTPPTLEEVRQYIVDNPEIQNVDPETFWKGFTDGGWIDTQGKPVRNWKLKLHTWSHYGTRDKTTGPKQRHATTTRGDLTTAPASQFGETIEA
jgi:hypothetical protein